MLYDSIIAIAAPKSNAVFIRLLIVCYFVFTEFFCFQGVTYIDNITFGTVNTIPSTTSFGYRAIGGTTKVGALIIECVNIFHVREGVVHDDLVVY